MLAPLLALACTSTDPVELSDVQTRAQSELGAARLFHPAGELRVLQASGNGQVIVAEIGPETVAEVARVQDVPLPAVTNLAGTEGAFYVANGPELLTYSLAAPTLPVMTDQQELELPLSGMIRSLSVHGDTLYATADGGGGFLAIFDISDPEHPELVELVDGWIGGPLTVHGDLAFSQMPVQILDLSDPYAPKVLGELELDTPTFVAHGPESLFVANLDGVFNVDVSDPSAPRVIAESSDRVRSGLAWYGGWLWALDLSTVDGVVPLSTETLEMQGESRCPRGLGLFGDEGLLVSAGQTTAVCW